MEKWCKMVRKILEEKPIPLGQVYELLTIREESGINYVQRVTAQHAEKLSRDAAYSEEVLETLQNEFGLSRLLAVQIVNLNPKTAKDVKAITKEILSADQIEQLLERYSEFVTKIAAAAAEEPDKEEEEAGELEEGFDDL
jgi:DNA-directed RNA polymerase subunit F